MKPQSSNPHTVEVASFEQKREKGFVLVCMVIMLGLLLSFAALAIDSGNMYLWRLRLEKAARAGVISGLGYRALVGWQGVYGGPPEFLGPTGNKLPTTRNNVQWNTLLAQVREAVLSNLVGHYPQGQFDPNAFTFVDNAGVPINALPYETYNPINDTITVSATYEIPSILAGRLSFAGFSFLGCAGGNTTRCKVGTTQTASLKPATIGMVLDTSGSMACELGDPSCQCRYNTVNPCGSSGPQLIHSLQSAAITFHTFFNPFRDRIALIPFNIGATVSRPIIGSKCVGGAAINPNTVQSFGASEDNYKQFIASIAGEYPANVGTAVPGLDQNCNSTGSDLPGLIPVSNTNHCDALVQAAQEVEAVRQRDITNKVDSPIFYVFFTDGAPNAMRATFVDSAANRLENAVSAGVPPGPSGPLNQAPRNDWYQYSLEWVDQVAGILTRYRGPGPLVHARSREAMFNFEIKSTAGVSVTFPTTPTYPAAVNGIPCGDNWSDPTQFDRALDGNQVFTGPQRQGCLSTPRFTLPGLAGAPTVSDVPFSEVLTPAPNRIPMIDQLHYYCALEAADWMRLNHRAPVFAVGLGPEYPTGCSDILQDADNSFSRKDTYLNRLAMTPIVFDNPGNLVTSPWKDSYDFSYRRQMSLIGCPTAPVVNVTDPPPHRLHALGINSVPVGYDVENASLQSVRRFPAAFGTTNEQIEDLSGTYFGTSDATQLRNHFTRIAKQILLRLST